MSRPLGKQAKNKLKGLGRHAAFKEALESIIDPREVLKFLVQVMKGKPLPCKVWNSRLGKNETQLQVADLELRAQIGYDLTNRYFGKATEYVDTTSGGEAVKPPTLVIGTFVHDESKLPELKDTTEPKQLEGSIFEED
jgi:hypothetical protein